MKNKKDNFSKILNDGDDLINSIFKTLIDSSLSDTKLHAAKQQEQPIGKLMWRQKKVLSHDTRVSPRGDLVTEIVYKVPVVFEKENPDPIKIGKIITALESMLDQKYSNFINIQNCFIDFNDDKYYIKASAVFHDHGPSKKEK